MAKKEETRVVEFDTRKGAAQQEAEIERLRREGWAVRSVELGPDGRKRLYLVKGRATTPPKD